MNVQWLPRWSKTYLGIVSVTLTMLSRVLYAPASLRARLNESSVEYR